MRSLVVSNEELRKTMRKGALLRTNQGPFYPAFMQIKNRKADYGLEMLYRRPEEPLSRWKCLLITNYDRDEATGKWYFPYSGTDYVQLLPFTQEQLLTAITLQRQEYLYLTNDLLPAKARAEHWPIKDNHCIQRILLDHLVGGAWPDHLRRLRIPAYQQLDLKEMGRLLRSAHALYGKTKAEVTALNRQSLGWRKPKK